MKPDSVLSRCYTGRRVLVTGTTGFKGSWLALWLSMLGAEVWGFGLSAAADRPCHYGSIGLASRIHQVFGDVTDLAEVSKVVRQCRPCYIFHLAAQPLVQEAMRVPAWTFKVNLLGTVNILEAASQTDSVRSVVCITSDKCYQNQEWVWAYRETDELGGDDPYSASKAAAEMAIASFRATVYPARARHVGIASARAGNVIGGGDWSDGRLVPDLVRWAFSGHNLSLRSPYSTRPWQHVLEPLSGYLWLGARLLEEDEPYSSSWNFGPYDDAPVTAEAVTEKFAEQFGREPPRKMAGSGLDGPDARPLYDARTLQLDSRKAHQMLGWRSTWTLDETIDATAVWYQEFYRRAGRGMADFSEKQIATYCRAAMERGLRWASPG